MLCDKVYAGAWQFLRAIHLRRKPPNENFSITEKAGSDLVAIDRVIVENFSGVCALFGFFYFT